MYSIFIGPAPIFLHYNAPFFCTIMLHQTLKNQKDLSVKRKKMFSDIFSKVVSIVLTASLLSQLSWPEFLLDILFRNLIEG